MRQVNIRKLRSGLASELKDLPFEVTKGGVVVAVVQERVIDNDEYVREYLAKKKGVPPVAPAPTYFNPQPKKK